MAARQQPVEVDGRSVSVSNLDKVMYPATGTTKGDVLDYYRAVAPWFVAHNAGRPATRKRWVDGVGTTRRPGHAFFHKNLDPASTPDWVRTRPLTHQDGESRYPLVDDAATLVWLAQLAALEIHVPQWRFGPRGGRRDPDRLVLDLDPGPGAGLAECVEVAHRCRELLDGMGLTSVPVTSGSKGIHLYAALERRHSAEQVTTVAHELARQLERDLPGLVVSDMKKSLRDGKVLLDWSQNNGSKTTVAPYSLRGRTRPTVAAPRSWEELDEHLEQLEYAEVLDRLRRIGDPMAAFADVPDRLTTYRSMRDAARTPEPVPSDRPGPGEGTTFVIQEHHARALHWDFRLERDGVLVSWAVPKGPPTDPRTNHLAVQTEDHPMEYAGFEGSIPRGEYGGGEVTIWDAGTYETEKWRDGKEVIAALYGRPDGGLGGPRRFALIHTRQGGDEKNWLMHRMDDPPPRPGSSAGGGSPGEASGRRTAAPGSRRRLPTVEPMLATLGTVDDLGAGEWAYETKWDGIRAVATVRGGEVRLTSRNGKDLTATYPELGSLGGLLGEHDAVLDGEVVALEKDGRSDFGLLQQHATGGVAHYMVFDLLHLDGDSLLRSPYAQRRARLEELLGEDEHVHLPPTFGGDQENALRTSRELRLEGVVAKRVDSVYQPGRRARTWVKIKNQRMQEVVVVGWRPGTGRRASTFGSLLLAVTDGDRLTYVGRVGAGFGEAALADVQSRLRGRARRTPPLDDVPRADARDAHWVRPDLVGEVTYAEWTGGGRLRQPVWRGWRPDKDAADVVRADG